MTYYEELFQELEKAHVRYLVVGGVAVILHGFVRATADLDLMVGLDPDNLNIFLDLMKKKGYKPKAPVAIENFADEKIRKVWIKEKGMLVFSLFHPQKPMELIDIFVNEPIPFAEAYKRKKTVPLKNTTVSLMSLPDLIKLKKIAGRPQDIQDIEALQHQMRKKTQ